MAEDVYIDNDMWEHLKTKKETLFVKDLLSYIVGEYLNEYALKAKKSWELGWWHRMQTTPGIHKEYRSR